MRGDLKCGIIHGVIIYSLRKVPEISDFSRDSHEKVLVADLAAEKSLKEDIVQLLESSGNSNYGLNLVPSKKITKNSEFKEDFSKIALKCSLIFVDNDFLEAGLLEFKGVVKAFLTLSPKLDPRNYEAKFNMYKNLGVDGINFDIEKVTKGHLALCSKFGLDICATNIEYERHLEKAEQLNINKVLI